MKPKYEAVSTPLPSGGMAFMFLSAEGLTVGYTTPPVEGDEGITPEGCFIPLKEHMMIRSKPPLPAEVQAVIPELREAYERLSA